MKDLKLMYNNRENLEERLPWIWLEFGQMHFKVQNTVKKDHGHGQEWQLVTLKHIKGKLGKQSTASWNTSKCISDLVKPLSLIN